MNSATPARRRALPLVSLYAAAATALFVLAAQRGWLGPDAGRGAEFCEAARAGIFAQPANTLSNLGFVVAGLALAARLDRSGGMPWGLGTAYALVVVTLGPGSAAMHATQSDLGGHLDLLSMYLVSGFVAAYATMRLVGGGGWVFARVWLVAVFAQVILERRGGPMPVLMHTGNLGFALTLLTGIALEVVLARRGRGLPGRWLGGALAALAIGFAVWNLAKDGGPLCHPHSLVQGHALWHLACALAAYCVGRAYLAGRTR